MKLSDVDIKKALASGQIEIDPPVRDEEIGAMSLDLQLANEFRVFMPGKAGFVDLAPPVGSPPVLIEDMMGSVNVKEGDAFFLHPGEFALGVTIQRVKLAADLAGRLDGRSSLARLGLMVHATAHTIDPGWNGCITLEFFNCGRLPLAMRPGMRICALSFETLSSPSSKPYNLRANSKYKGQDRPIPSRIGEEA